MKAISSVIASILMLLVTIAIAGTAYMYITGVFTRQTATSFSITNSYQDVMYVSNDGTTMINGFTATVDNQPVQIAVVPNIGGLVGYWSFNDGSGSTITRDSSGLNNTGTLVNMNTSGNETSGWATDCKYGNCLRFDKVDDTISVGDKNSLEPQRFSLVAWIKHLGSTDFQTIHTKSTYGTFEGYEIYVIPNNRIEFWMGNGVQSFSFTSNSILNPNTWYHVIGIYDGGSMKIYINGLPDNELPTGSQTIYYAGTSFAVGSHYSGRYFNGTIDEVSVYNRALSDQEVRQLYSGLLLPGKTATVRLLTSLSKGFHNVRLCTSGMCRSGHVMIV